jgi:uncharacterized RDD family membrane protein YckC
MNKLWIIPLVLVAGFGTHVASAALPSPPPPPKLAKAAPPPPPPPVVDINVDSDEFDEDELPSRGADVVAVGHDVSLARDASAKSVVAVMGSAVSEGTARDVVAVLGDATVNGPVDKDVVAVLGNVRLDNAAGHDVVSVLGSVDLGPNAKVGHDVVVVGGTLKRDPAATIGHSTNIVTIGNGFGNASGLRAWIRECLLLGRPLALDSRVSWAWGIAIAFTLFYALLALLFRGGMNRCVQTFQTRPGASLLTALLSVVLSPLAIIVLAITIVGALFIPVFAIGMMVAALFGKAVFLAWMGQALTAPLIGRSDADPRPALHPALAVLIGGVVMMALYLVPFIGFLAYKLTDLIGLGIVLLTVLTLLRTARDVRTGPPAAGTAMGSAGAAATAQAAAVPGAAFAAAPPGIAGEMSGAAPAPAPGIATAPPPPPVAPAPLHAHAGMERASFWQRMAALFLDAVLVGIVVSTIGHVHSLMLLILATYGCVMWVLRGTTIGGSVLGIHVVRLDGRPVDWATGIVRGLGCFLSLVVAGLGFIWIAFDPEKQAWHDKIAGTVVVRRPGGTSMV